jgi:hypothetical protein
LKRFVFDTETNGLLEEVTTLHSLVIHDLGEDIIYSCYPGSVFKDLGKTIGTARLFELSLEEGLKMLEEADILYGHNIIGYDLKVLKKLYPHLKIKATLRDTLIMAKMIWPMDRLKELDFPRFRKGTLPGQLIGAQRLEAWGYRLGELKGDYSATVKDFSKQLKSGTSLSEIPEEYHVLYCPKTNTLDPWKAWNRPMQDYCVTDVVVSTKLLDLVQSHLSGSAKAAGGKPWSERSVDLEHEVFAYIDRQTDRGFGFNHKSAVNMASELKARQYDLEQQLVTIFGEWWQPLDDPEIGTTSAIDRQVKQTQFKNITQRRVSEKTGKELKPYVGPPLESYLTDAPYVRIKRVTFNPKSRQHLGDRLQSVFGWKPVEFGGAKGDQAKVDETTIKNIHESVLPKELRETILEYLVISKTLGQLADGKKAWIDLYNPTTGRLHGRMDTLGTVSHRAAHFNPNLGQVPSVQKREIKDDEGNLLKEEIVTGWHGGFGGECRALFQPGRAGWEQTGVDASGLELRLLGHYLQPFDGGEFAARVSSPGLDIHTENAKITGLTRAATKTVTYAFLYGAGPLKIGIGVGVDPEDIDDLANSAEAKSYVGWQKRTFKKDFVQPDKETLAFIAKGSQVSKAFMDGITGLKDFKKSVTDVAKDRGYLVGLDGRKLSIRKPHAAINQLLQGGGAVVCKMWMIETAKVLENRYGLKEDVDWGQMAWVHDENQYEHKQGLHETIAKASEEAMQIVGDKLNFRGKLGTDSKNGRNWQECH